MSLIISQWHKEIQENDWVLNKSTLRINLKEGSTNINTFVVILNEVTQARGYLRHHKYFQCNRRRRYTRNLQHHSDIVLHFDMDLGCNNRLSELWPFVQYHLHHQYHELLQHRQCPEGYLLCKNTIEKWIEFKKW